MASIASGESLVLQFVRMPSAAGTRVQVRFLSEKFPAFTAGAITATSFVKTGAVTVTSLPVGRHGGRGRPTGRDRRERDDLAGAVAGGGSNIVPVYSNGTNWRIG